MIIFKILLIILVAAPVIALSVYLYSQMIAFIREKNRHEKAMIESERFERKARKRSEGAAGKKAKKTKKAEKTSAKTGTGSKRSLEK